MRGSTHLRGLPWLLLISLLVGTCSFGLNRFQSASYVEVDGRIRKQEMVAWTSRGKIGLQFWLSKGGNKMKNPRRQSHLYSSSNIDGGNARAKAADTIDLLYDGDCPICMMEVAFLRKRDVKGRIRFTDLRDPTYNPADHGDVTFEQGMRKLRAVLPDGKVVMGVEVFRKTYKAIGLGWVFELTNLPVVGKVADNLYDFWADNRLRLTGRGELADILKARAQELQEMDEDFDCEEECGLDYDDLP